MCQDRISYPVTTGQSATNTARRAAPTETASRLIADAPLHVDTPDTPNWYLKRHQGLDYLNMAMAQVTDNPALAAGYSIHHGAKQQLLEYIRAYIWPLICAGKQASWHDILLQINRRKPKLVQQIGTQQVQNILKQVINLKLVIAFALSTCR